MSPGRAADRDGSVLPTGTITFLFTDIEASTRILEKLGDAAYDELLAAHDAIIEHAIADGDGRVVRTMGDAFFAVFTDARRAVESAILAQRGLATHPWPDGARLRVRMGLHSGRGVVGVGNDYVGLDVHRAARISDAGHGGQIVVSESTAGLVGDQAEFHLRDLGSHHLKDVAQPERLYQVEARGLGTVFPALRTITATPGNLPQERTSFVGRSRELRDGEALLREARLVTLTGPGGTGKTRLALRLAAAMAPRFRGGVFFVPLAAITDPDLIPTQILDALDLKPAGDEGAAETLASVLADKQALLVLDNFEQIVAGAHHVAELLAVAPALSVIVTSRAPLHVEGEHEFPVPPLAAPRDTSAEAATLEIEAVRLFRDRARAVRPGFELTPENRPAVAALTQRLDGLPLAIELAASRVKLLTPGAMLERLDNKLLRQTAGDRPSRQQTITNAIAWSYDLLGEPARRLFERCSVFAGDARLSEIETVCGPEDDIGAGVIDTLEELVDHSLLEQREVSGDPRCRMLVVVREFAAEALATRGESDELRARHGVAYADMAARAAPHLLTSHHMVWLTRLHADDENLRAALDWAISADEVDLALRMVADLWRFWQIRGRLGEASDWIEATLALEGGEPVLRARALEAHAGILYWRGHWDLAREPYSEALRIMRDRGDPADVANALYNASFAEGYVGDRTTAIEYLEEARSLYESIGDHRGVGRAHWGLCDQASFDRDWEAVITHALDAVAELERVDAPFDVAWAWFMLAHAHHLRGDPSRAASYLDRAIPFFLETNDLSAIALVLSLEGANSYAAGMAERGAQLAGAADALARKIGAGITSVDANQYPALSRLRDDRRREIREAFDRGVTMSVEAAIELALDR